LAKPAMAVHHQHGFRARRVSNCSAKTSALKCHPYLRKRSDISLIRGLTSTWQGKPLYASSESESELVRTLYWTNRARACSTDFSESSN
jgi:hypothetical protein